MDYVGRSGVNTVWKAAERAAVEVGDAVAALRNPGAIAHDVEKAQRSADLFAHEALHRMLASGYPGVPIISEEDASSYNADYYLLLPWHFKDGIIARESQFLSRGGKFIVPFPEIEIV